MGRPTRSRPDSRQVGQSLRRRGERRPGCGGRAPVPAQTTGCAVAKRCCAMTGAGAGSLRDRRCAMRRPFRSWTAWRCPAEPTAEHRTPPAASTAPSAGPTTANAARERRSGGRWIVAAFGICPGEAERHRRHPNARIAVEGVAIYSKPFANRSPEGSSNGIPLSCTRRPGAWPQIKSRVSETTRSTGRGSW